MEWAKLQPKAQNKVDLYVTMSKNKSKIGYPNRELTNFLLSTSFLRVDSQTLKNCNIVEIYKREKYLVECALRMSVQPQVVMLYVLMDVASIGTLVTIASVIQDSSQPKTRRHVWMQDKVILKSN